MLSYLSCEARSIDYKECRWTCHTRLLRLDTRRMDYKECRRTCRAKLLRLLSKEILLSDYKTGV